MSDYHLATTRTTKNESGSGGASSVTVSITLDAKDVRIPTLRKARDVLAALYDHVNALLASQAGEDE